MCFNRAFLDRNCLTGMSIFSSQDEDIPELVERVCSTLNEKRRFRCESTPELLSCAYRMVHLMRQGNWQPSNGYAWEELSVEEVRSFLLSLVLQCLNCFSTTAMYLFVFLGGTSWNPGVPPVRGVFDQICRASESGCGNDRGDRQARSV